MGRFRIIPGVSGRNFLFQNLGAGLYPAVFKIFLEPPRSYLEELEEVGLLFFPLLLLVGPTTYRLLGERIEREFQDRKLAVSVHFVGPSTEEEVAKAAAHGRAVRCQGVLAVGGGRVLDVGKRTAWTLDVPFISVPTAPSNDGIASPVAVISGRSLFSKPPDGVLAPVYAMTTAPLRHILAGVGDLVANLTAVWDWRLAHRVRGEPLDHMAALLSETAGELMLTSNTRNPRSLPFLDRLVRGLFMSGIAMGLVGSSRPASGAEHKISHAIDALFSPRPTLHGEQTALGTVIASRLQGWLHEEITGLFRELGLPTHPQDLGLSLDQLAEALVYAPRTRPGRYTILEHLKIGENRAHALVRELFESP